MRGARRRRLWPSAVSCGAGRESAPSRRDTHTSVLGARAHRIAERVREKTSKRGRRRKKVACSKELGHGGGRWICRCCGDAFHHRLVETAGWHASKCLRVDAHRLGGVNTDAPYHRHRYTTDVENPISDSYNRKQSNREWRCSQPFARYGQSTPNLIRSQRLISAAW